MKTSILKLECLFFVFFISLTSLYSKDLKIIYTSHVRDITQNASYDNLQTLLNKYKKNSDVLFLFGGNSLAPSLISNMDKGEHIISILNYLEPDVYAVGASEFAFSTDEFCLKTYDANFPFILSNVKREDMSSLEGTFETIMVKKSNLKIGIVNTLRKIDKQKYAIDDIKIFDEQKSIIKNSKVLKKQGANIIVLLSQNISLANKMLHEDIVDIAFSRSDLLKKSKKILKNNIVLTKNNEIAVISVNDNSKFNIYRDSLLNYKKDKKVNTLINEYIHRINSFLNEKIARTNTVLNTKKINIRQKENIFANLLADSIRYYTSAQISFINAGTIRGNKIYKKNQNILRKDINKELPFKSKVILLSIKGKYILEALENSLSLYNDFSGRFLQVSGMKVIFDTSKTKGNRVKKVFIGKNKLEKNKEYLLATIDYLYKGGDDYKMLKNARIINSIVPREIDSLFIDYISKKKFLNLSLEKRLVNLEKKQ